MKTLKGVALFKLLLLCILGLSLVLTRIPDQPYHPVTAQTQHQDLHVIEFNDNGQMHLPEQWLALTQRIAQEATPPELLIFIHGWHHNAAPTDENYIAFQQFYRSMADKNPQRKLLGLYIGWRGDQYDPFWLDGSDDPQSQVEALDFPTIFSSRRVAQQIGETGLSALLDQLEDITQAGRLKRYVLIGHSLGGAMGLYASKNRIKSQIERQQSSPNLTLFLNPAVPIQAYKPLDTLLTVDNDKPRMMVLQSKGDFAVKQAFNWLQSGERALGNSWAITHDIDQCPNNNCNIQLKLPPALQAHDDIPGCMRVMPLSGWKIRARLNARKTVLTCQDANQQAVWVLAVSDEIINGHNGILTPQHAIALSEMMQVESAIPAEMPAFTNAKEQITPLTDHDEVPTPDEAVPVIDVVPLAAPQ